MHESIYRFLLESGYPRASIITDPQVLDPGPAFGPTTVERNGPGSSLGTTQARKPTSDDTSANLPGDGPYQPAVMIVDPDSYERLAVIDIIESDSAEDVVSGGLRVLHYASRFTNQHIQSFIMQFDMSSPVKSEQVKFYKLSRQNKILPLPPYAFPDLATLRVTRMMEIDAGLRRDPRTGQPRADEKHTGKPSRDTAKDAPVLLFFLALVLVLLAIVDWLLMYTRGFGVFTTQQILLFVAAVFLLAVPLLLRLHRQ